jgi:hypothetical protein
MKKTGRILLVVVVLIFGITLLVACGDEGGGGGDRPRYVIGVIPFSDVAAEQIEWNNYLENYVGPALNVDFRFVPAPGFDAGAAVTAVEELALAGVQGILGINDMPAAIERANELEIWFVRPGGLSTMENYEAVRHLPFYLGTMGPGLDEEYQAMYDAVQHFIGKGAENILLHAALLGLGMPTDMHATRLQGAVDALVAMGAIYRLPESGNVFTGPGAGEIEPGASGLNVTMIHGVALEFLDPGFNERFTLAASGQQFDAVIAGGETATEIATLLTGMGIPTAPSSEVGAITPVARAAFEAGILDFLVGKHPSSMGPGVVALINAIDGHADVVRTATGQGSRLVSPFWTAESFDEFMVMYEFDNIANPAFNRALMEQYIVRLNPNVTRESFAAFVGLSFEELRERHSG